MTKGRHNHLAFEIFLPLTYWERMVVKTHSVAITLLQRGLIEANLGSGNGSELIILIEERTQKKHVTIYSIQEISYNKH